MKESTVNQEISDRITVIDSDGNRITGLILSNFTYKVRNPSGTDVTGSVSVSLVELGDGVYFFKFTPNVEGVWTAWLDHATYGKWDSSYRVTSIETDVSSILTDTDEIQTKLPTNNIMGSSVKDDKDDEINAIKSITDNLPDSGALTTLIDHMTDIKGSGWTDENLTTLDSLIDSIKIIIDNLPNSGSLTTLITHLTDIKGSGWTNENLKTMDSLIDSILDDTDTMEVDLKTYMDTKESNIRGSDSDDLKGISDQIDPLATESNATTNKNTITAAISATESNIRGTDSDTLKDLSDQIDPLSTEVNATANTNTITSAISTAENNIRGTDSDDLKVISDQIDLTAKETNATTNTSNITSAILTTENNIRGVDSDDLKTISDQIDLTATETNATTNTNTITSAVTNAHTDTDAKIDNANTHLTDIKGAGWVDETLVTIKSALDSGNTNLETNLKAYMDVIEDNIRGATDKDITVVYDYLVSTKIDLVNEINANEGKIDIIDVLIDSIVAKLPTQYIMGSSVQASMDEKINNIYNYVDNVETNLSDVKETVERLLMMKEEFKIISITRNSRGKPLVTEWETYTDSTHTVVRNTYRMTTTYTPLGFIDTTEVVRLT